MERLPDPIRPAARTRALALGAALLLLLRGAAVALDDPSPSSPSLSAAAAGEAALLPDRDTPALEPAVRCDDRSSAITSSSAHPRPAFWAAPAPSPRPANALPPPETRPLMIQALIFEHYLAYRESLSVP